MDEWSKSQNISSEQTDRTEPQPPPQAHTEQVNVVFTGSGKSDDHLKIQKDPPPSIIVTNKTKKDKPIKTSKKGYHVHSLLVLRSPEYPKSKKNMLDEEEVLCQPLLSQYLLWKKVQSIRQSSGT
ncbi:hypothetical protein Tco_0532360 [Tanacetum coccineum]